MQAWADETRQNRRRIAFVPTMGYLHEGHLSLIREGGKHADEIVVSIFVNPTQFGPGEDLDAYPRNFERDCTLAEDAGADVIFSPVPDGMYGDRYQTYVALEHLPHHLCGISRPVHFRGVATVVSKLFNIVKPHVAVFGQKDFQQLQVIRQMVADLNFDIEIIGAPIVREEDGLAMSSRNTYLSDTERKQALCLSQALESAKAQITDGVRDAERIRETARRRIEAQPDARIDYIAVCHPDTLEDLETVEDSALLALAVKIGATRLIDNTLLICKSYL